MDYSIFFFADSDAAEDDRYRLLFDCARYADNNGFTAVWTPERHFHRFGGIYPNPSVVGAALAVQTKHLQIRAGSVVAPLHHPARIAEEWSIVDNLSNGRVGVSFASGWHATDFLLRPDAYVKRKNCLAPTVDAVKRLWRGESLHFTDGNGETVNVGIFPTPIQDELPVWITSAGSIDTFRLAGSLGANVLTHLLGQSLEELAEKIAAYRAELVKSHGSHTAGTVSLMAHTLVGDDREDVRDAAREPLRAYLASSLDLVIASSGIVPPGTDPSQISREDKEAILNRSFERYFSTSGLFGTLSDAHRFVTRATAAGVDEIACLIDYGVPTADVMQSLQKVARLAAEKNVRATAGAPARDGASMGNDLPTDAPTTLREHDNHNRLTCGTQSRMTGGSSTAS